MHRVDFDSENERTHVVMDPKPTDAERLAQRRLDEVAEILSRAVLRILGQQDDAAATATPKKTRRRSPKSDSPAR